MKIDLFVGTLSDAKDSRGVFVAALGANDFGDEAEGSVDSNGPHMTPVRISRFT